MDASNVATEGLPAPPDGPALGPRGHPKFDDWTQMLEAMHCGLTTSAMAV
jgi:hypothetical protein